MSERLVELLDPKPGQTVLDIAAGPGDTGLLALPRLLPGGRLVSTDIAPEMVEAARRRADELGVADDVSFQVEDAASMSFADASIDGVLCRWGLMLVPDMDAAVAEIARVLRPHGRASVAVWGDPEANDWMTAAGRSAVELGLMERPDPNAPGPFRLSGDGALETVLERGGLTVQTVEDVSIVWSAPSLEEWWDVVTDMSRALKQLVEQISADDVAAVRRGAERRLERHVRADGTLTVPGVARVALAQR